MKLFGVTAVFAVYGYSSRDGDEAEDVVAKDWCTTLGEFVIDAFEVTLDDKYIGRAAAFGVAVCITVSTAVLGVLVFGVYDGLISLQDIGDVYCSFGYFLVEVGKAFEAHLAYEVVHDTFVTFYLVVLELAYNGFASHVGLLGTYFFQCLTYLGACSACLCYVKPCLLGRLAVRRDDFYLVAVVQHVAYGNVAAVDKCSGASATEICVYREGEVEYCRSFGEPEKVAFGSENENLVFVKLHLELVFCSTLFAEIFQCVAY